MAVAPTNDRCETRPDSVLQGVTPCRPRGRYPAPALPAPAAPWPEARRAAAACLLQAAERGENPPRPAAPRSGRLLRPGASLRGRACGREGRACVHACVRARACVRACVTVRARAFSLPQEGGEDGGREGGGKKGRREGRREEGRREEGGREGGKEGGVREGGGEREREIDRALCACEWIARELGRGSCVFVLCARWSSIVRVCKNCLLSFYFLTLKSEGGRVRAMCACGGKASVLECTRVRSFSPPLSLLSLSFSLLFPEREGER